MFVGKASLMKPPNNLAHNRYQTYITGLFFPVLHVTRRGGRCADMATLLPCNKLDWIGKVSTSPFLAQSMVYV